MEIIVLVIHIILAIAVVAVILIQPSEGGMGAMGGGSPMGGMAKPRGRGNLLTRITAVLVTLFISTSLILAIMAGRENVSDSVLDLLPQETAITQDEVSDDMPSDDTTPETSPDLPEVPISQ